MEIFLQDLRYAGRKLLRTPGFTFVAVATLALAIGATTAVFSIVNGVLLKPLPFRDPDAVVAVGAFRGGKLALMSGVDFLDYRKQTRSFVDMAALDQSNGNLTASGSDPLRVALGHVGAPFFDLLGVKMQLGRAFIAGEDERSAARTIVLSDRLWHSRFNGDPKIIGQPVAIDGNTYTVIGVAPRSMTYPDSRDAWIPLVWEDWMIDPSNRGAHWLNGIARIRPGVTLDAAQREMHALGERLRAEYPKSNANIGATVVSLRERLVGNVTLVLVTMLGAVGFVLLIACANVANLLLVRAASRETEIAVRTALGAGRGRILRQLVTESVLLSALGAMVGCAIAAWAVDAVVALGPRDLPRLNEVGIDSRVLLFAIGISLLTGVLFGLVPALHAAKPNVGEMLKENVRGSTSRRAAHRTRNALVMSEMALAVVLLVGAGLLIRSFVKLIEVDPGFRTENVVSFSVSVPDKKYPFDRDKNRFADQMLASLASMPGAQSSAVALSRPMQNVGMRTSFDIEGRPPAPDDAQLIAAVRPVSAGYFSALGIKLDRGRTFSEQESHWGPPPVVVVTEAFVKKYFPNENPVGQRIKLGISHDTAETDKTGVTSRGEIIGVVADVKQTNLSEVPQPTVYVPHATFPQGTMAFVVRANAEASTMTALIRQRIREIDAEMPLYDVQTMSSAVSASLAQPRFYTMLLGAFALLALLLAALGIYGVISYAVSQRTRELGIRIALGATHERVVRLVLGQGMLLTATGIVLGTAGAWWLVRLLSSQLYGVSATDVATFASVPLVLLGVASLATYLPARRAARVDPVIAMRAE
jgi:predicted permease